MARFFVSKSAGLFLLHRFRTVTLAATVILAALTVASRAPLPDPARSRSFTFRYVVHLSALPAGSHQLRIWVPLPYEDSYQRISALRIKAPVPYQIRRESVYHDRYAYFAVNTEQIDRPVDIDLAFHVKRFEHRVRLDASDDPASGPADLTRFLQPDRLVPIDGEIAELSRQQTQGATTAVEKARKIYDYVIATLRYDHEGTGWGRGDAIWACTAKHGNCTDFHSLFIAMGRAAGVPARFEIGFPLPANAHEGAIPSYHCWAEFHADGTGWIPIDASEAWKNPAKHDYFFGATDANRVMFSRGRDLRLDPPQAGDPLNYFVYPYAEVDGKPFADLKSDVSFRDDDRSESAQEKQKAFESHAEGRDSAE
jgi:transglutaminase-like putative cysteine protease